MSNHIPPRSRLSARGLLFSRQVPRRLIGIALLLSLLALFHLIEADTSALQISETRAAAGAVEAGWLRAQKSGGYHFTSDVTQTTIPQAIITNIGSTSREERLYLGLVCREKVRRLMAGFE